jgi:ribosomal protein L21E
MFNRGDRVEVVSDNYAETPAASFTGRTGEVTGADNRIVTIQFPGETSPKGFGHEEVKRSK